LKKATILYICLLLSVTVLARTAGNSAQSNDGFEAFRQKFKAAVLSSDKETVVGLSRFPIRMPGRVRNVKDAADLRQRYREVFNKRVNAAKCFAKEEPTKDTDNSKRYFISCFDGKGDDIDYVFEFTKTGWKFVRVDQFTLPD
jgi:hypothetical protein